MVGESVSVSAGLLGEHVDVLDPAVRGAAGRVVGEDLGCPAVDGAGESGQLWDLSVGAVLQEHDESTVGVRGVDRGVDLAQQLSGEDGRTDFAVGVTGGEQLEEPGEAVVAESFPTGAEYPSAAVERIALAAPMPRGSLVGLGAGRRRWLRWRA